jgi:hypothetical protein
MTGNAAISWPWSPASTPCPLQSPSLVETARLSGTRHPSVGLCWDSASAMGRKGLETIRYQSRSGEAESEKSALLNPGRVA